MMEEWNGGMVEWLKLEDVALHVPCPESQVQENS